MGARTLAGLVTLAVAAGAAHAQVLYKWTDAQGKVHYGDKPPKDFKGPVTRLDAEPAPSVPLLPRKPKPEPRAVEKGNTAEAPVEDIAAKRRATRNALEARVVQARERLDAAKDALAKGAEPMAEDRQVVQQRVAGVSGGAATPNADPTQARATTGGMHGMAARANCRAAKDAAGKPITICPASVPTPEFQEKVAQLEAAVKKAEEELAAAEEAYRRGVD